MLKYKNIGLLQSTYVVVLYWYPADLELLCQLVLFILCTIDVCITVFLQKIWHILFFDTPSLKYIKLPLISAKQGNSLNSCVLVYKCTGDFGTGIAKV